jgi:ADP-heptose:LPS heptosyltransferase
MAETPRTFLILLPNNLGDVIMATPILEGLKEKHPGCRCSFFVEEGFEAGLENNPHCDEIIRFPRKKIKVDSLDGSGDSGYGLLKEYIGYLREKKFDGIINLSQHPYVSFITGLIACDNSVGQRFLPEGNHAILDAWSGYLYSVAFARRCNGFHAIDVYRRIAGIKNFHAGYAVALTLDEKKWAQKYLIAKNVNGQKKIMIFQAGAAYASKRWPVENFIKLGLLLVADDWQIVLTGAPSEKDLTLGIKQGIGRECFIAAGETTFRQSMALCSLANGCVTGDTAQMHAAAALNVATYAIFGPTNPVETGPYGNGHFVFSARCPKRPCFETDCKTGICMRSVLPETVLACIHDHTPGTNPRCDVYKTIVEKDVDYKLVPLSSDANAYFAQVDAFLTRKAFEPVGDMTKMSESDMNLSLAQTRQWLCMLEDMRQSLDDYRSTGNKDFVRLFEQKKSSLTALKGIGEFWTAMLNIGLNSVPLIDVSEGIKKYSEVCDEIDKRLRFAIEPYVL